MQFYWNPSTDAAWNLALEESLWRGGYEACMLWQNAPAVIVGRHQNTAAEVCEALARERGIAIVRRVTGGGAVYHDLGNINFTLTLPAGKWSPEQCLAPVLKTLHDLGASGCCFSGRNDLLCGGVKISGSARSMQKNRMLFHGTLLYDSDLQILSAILTPDPDKIHAKGVASVRARVGNLRTFLPGAPETGDFLNMFSAGLARNLQLAGPLPLPGELIRAAGELAETRYRNRDWNWGTAFPMDHSRKKQFAAGWVTACVRVRDHRISAVRFTGDFLASDPVEELENGLIGTVPEYEALVIRLRELDSQKFLEGASPELLAPLLCL